LIEASARRSIDSATVGLPCSSLPSPVFSDGTSAKRAASTYANAPFGSSALSILNASASRAPSSGVSPSWTTL
jgi:hypothetical protein